MKINDVEVQKIISAEERRQQDQIDLIPSENYASADIREATGSVLTNKYSEGYSHARYYAGNKYIDEIEDLAKARALKMFGLSEKSWHANVQPYSGSPANYEIYFALLEFGDKVLGMKLDQGGHITHGLPIGFAGKAYQFSSYGVSEKTGKLDYDEILKIAKKVRPKMIVCGATAYSRIIDFKKFSEIAKSVGAYLLADVSHIAGLIVGGVHQSPFPYADVVMTTTHKTLRGPRGAMIICRQELAKQIDRAVFPGMQGGPHDHVTAAMAICFEEAMKLSFKKYAEQIVKNAQELVKQLRLRGFEIVSGGTDNHLMLIDLQNIKITGKVAQIALEEAGIICNKNTIPYDPLPPKIGSGIRIGTPAITTRGIKEPEMKQIAEWLSQILKNINNKKLQQKIAKEVKVFCSKFPVPGLSTGRQEIRNES